MRYDDRLATVLRLIPVGPNVARIQYRQLLDLLGTSPVGSEGEMADAAYLRLAELGARIPPTDRSAMVAQPGLRLRSPRLIAALCEGEPMVAAAAIRVAQLNEEQWLDLIPALPLPARGFLRQRNDLGEACNDLLARLGIGAQPLPEAAPEAPPPGKRQPEPEVIDVKPIMRRQGDAPTSSAIMAAAPQADDDIGSLVRRIEEFRRARQTSPVTMAEPSAPEAPASPGASARAFDFASDGEGRIVWCDASVAPMVVGHLLSAAPTIGAAVRQHQPLRAMTVELAGAEAIAGEWQVDAVPRFDPLGGRFVGHLGRFRRPARRANDAAARQHDDSEADRLRQLLHELRTPVNAIQGFAEIIQQQLFGPAPHEYRALAAVIAADSARILAGFEELDRFAKLDSGAMDLAEGECDLADCVAATLARLQPQGAAAGARFRLGAAQGALNVALAPIEAERLCWRLMATLAGNAGDSEELAVALGAAGGMAEVRVALPAALAALDSEALYHAAAQPSGSASAGMFGTGFALRLAVVEAKAAGGQIVRKDHELVLALPLRGSITHSSPQQVQRTETIGDGR